VGVRDVQGMTKLRRRRADGGRIGAAQRQHGREQHDHARPLRTAQRLLQRPCARSREIADRCDHASGCRARLDRKDVLHRKECDDRKGRHAAGLIAVDRRFLHFESMPAKARKKATAAERERLQRQLRRRVDELEREREFIQTVVNSTPALFCVLDKDLRVLRYNQALETLFGLSGSERAPGQLFHEAFVAPGESGDVKRRLLTQADGVEHESVFRCADGSDAIVAWIKRRVTDSEGRPCVFFSGVDVTSRRREQEQLRASRARVVQAADAARHRIERDLHDGAQQHLVSAALALRIAQKSLKDGRVAATGKQLGMIQRELDEALEELRDLARGIHPAILTGHGLPDARETLAVRSVVPVEIEEAPRDRLGPQVEAAVYYVVAEALTNVAKYSRARVASVRVLRQGSHVLTEIEDDGVGGADPANGSGLRGLSDRVEALDGELTIDSPRGGPTILRARIPVS